MTSLLERALLAEEQLELAHERIEDLLGRLKSVLNAEPESATRALSWISRAEQSEKLLAEGVKKIDRIGPGNDFAPWLTRAKAQLHTVAILLRDQEAMGERPAEPEWWESWREDIKDYSLLRAGSDDDPVSGQSTEGGS